MKIALLPSTQWGNSVAGGGSEAQYAQDIAARVKAVLDKAGVICAVFAGPDDINASGAQNAVRWGPNLALSIHSDAGYYETSHHAALCCYQFTAHLGYAVSMMDSYCRAMGFANRGYQQRVYPNRVAVIRYPAEAGIPTILIECTWHDRNPDAAELRDGNWRQKCAESLAFALLKYIGISIPVIKQKPREVNMDHINLKGGQSDIQPWWISQSQESYLDVINLRNKNARVQVLMRRDNGDWSPDADKINLSREMEVRRLDVRKRWKPPEGGVSTKVEVLEGRVKIKYSEIVR